jgi:ketosteroid isomerase-like protein
MRKIWLLTPLFLFVMNTVFAQSADEKAVRNVMAQQTRDWNNGDTKSFMNSYWKSDSLMFVGKGGITYGWQQTLDNYNKHYPDTAAMGKLDFNLLSVKRLSAEYFFVIGKWHLARSVGDLNGAFTLLFRKINNHWLIVTDHSS